MGQNRDMYYALFLFSGTMVIYNVHRLIGILKGKDIVSDRFNKYRVYQYLLIGALVLCIVMGGYAFFKMTVLHYEWLLVAMALSLLYVVPVFPQHRRLRDYNMVKIWVIAIAWAMLTFAVPLGVNDGLGIILFIERVLFFVAITIPFDIRDLYIDNHQNVKTIPSVVGEQKALYSAKAIIIINAILLLSANAVLGFNPYPSGILFVGSYMATYIITYILILNTNKTRKDMYYTFWLDGTIGLPYIFYYLFLGIFMILR